MKHREPLDLYDTKPHGMSEYLRHNGWHFNRRMCEFAVSLMRKDGKRIDPWRKEDVDELLKSASVRLTAQTTTMCMWRIWLRLTSSADVLLTTPL